MGLLSLFGKGPLSEKRIAKIAKLAANPFAQPDVRMREMQRLLSDGSPAALRGVLRRFAANAQGHIADEDEKKWLEDALVERGEAALEPLRDYVGTEDKLTYALRAYRRIAGEEQAVQFFITSLERYGPEDYRSVEAKLQIVLQLGESLDDPRVLPALCPFLSDHSDDVRWAVLDYLERAADKGQLDEAVRTRASAEMFRLVSSDEAGPRIQKRTAEILVQRQWQVPESEKGLAAGLDAEYFLDKKRYVRRRVAAKA